MAGLLLWAALSGCGSAVPVDEAPVAPLHVVITGLDGVQLDEARLRLDAVILDHCGGTITMIPVERELDLLDPAGDPAWLLPGGYCGIQLVLPDDDAPDLVLAGLADGGSWAASVELGVVSVFEPFVVADESLLLLLALGDVVDGDNDIGPVTAELWRDLDGDGQLGPDDVPAT